MSAVVNITAIVEALVRAGATPEMILAAVRAAEAPVLERVALKREGDRQRKIRQREKEKQANSMPASRGQSVTECDTPSPSLDGSNGFPPDPLSLTSLNPPPTPKENPLKGVKEKSRPLQDFRSWYAEYPHKVGRAAAERAYAKARQSTDQATLLAGLRAYIASKPPDREWCNPATWLNQERWLDEPAAKSDGTTSNVDRMLEKMRKQADETSTLSTAGNVH